MNMNIGDTRLILAKCQKDGLLRNQAAYVLATAYHETAHTMQPIRETLADTDEQAIRRLDNAWQRGQLSWVSRPYWRDGWFGRGFVQLTHRYNYVKAGEAIGADMVADPSLALDADIAAEVLVRGMVEGWFTGKRLGDYVTLKASDYVGARRVVNGTDRARAIAEHARDYEAQLLADGYGSEKPAPIANERRDGTPARSTPVKSTTNISAIGGGVAVAAQLSDQVTETLGQVTERLGVSPEFALTALALAAFGWIFRERLRKWAEGDR